MLLAGLAAVLLPSGYAVAQMWQTVTASAQVAASETAGAAYLRPVTGLLAALVDAESAAARGVAVDDAAVRRAVEEVNRVDRSYGDELLARQRWAPVPDQIEAALKSPATGFAALNVYTLPIGLTQTLLASVASTSSALVDADPVAAKLVAVDVFDVVDIMVQAGRLVALIRSNPAQPSAVAVARDRIDKAATNVGDGLELVGDVNGGPGDVDLLNQIDGLTAAVLAMTRASAGADLSSAATRATIDTTRSQLQQTATALSSRLLTAFAAVVSARSDALGRQRAVLIGGAALVGAGGSVLIWACVSASRRGRTRRAAPEPYPTGGLGSHARTNDRRPDRAPHDRPAPLDAWGRASAVGQASSVEPE
jgi:hypothetical protein